MRRNREAMSEEKKIVIYGTTWCGDTRRARRVFDDNHIAYDWIDIDQDMEARKFVESVNNGYRSVPTIIFPDGSRMVEPSTTELMKRLGII
jgi:mycoredoxin